MQENISIFGGYAYNFTLSKQMIFPNFFFPTINRPDRGKLFIMQYSRYTKHIYVQIQIGLAPILGGPYRCAPSTEKLLQVY